MDKNITLTLSLNDAQLIYALLLREKAIGPIEANAWGEPDDLEHQYMADVDRLNDTLGQLVE